MLAAWRSRRVMIHLSRLNVKDPSSPSFGRGREEGSEAVCRPCPSLAVPAFGRCVCGGWPGGGVPASGLPVVRRPDGVLVWLVGCQNSCRASELGFYPQRLRSSASYTSPCPTRSP